MKSLKFNTLTKLCNLLMKDGKKTKSSKIINNIIKELLILNPYKDPVRVLLESIDKLSIPVKLIKLPRKYVKRQIKSSGTTKKIVLYKPVYFLKDGYKKGLSIALHMLFRGVMVHKKRLNPNEAQIAKLFAKEVLIINNFIHGFLNHKLSEKLNDKTNIFSKKNLLKKLTSVSRFNVNKSKIFNKYLKLIYIENIIKKLTQYFENMQYSHNILYFLILNSNLREFSNIWSISSSLKNKGLNMSPYYLKNQRRLKSLIYFFKETKRPRLFSATLFIYFRLLGYVNDKRRRIIYRW